MPAPAAVGKQISRLHRGRGHAVKRGSRPSTNMAVTIWRRASAGQHRRPSPSEHPPPVRRSGHPNAPVRTPPDPASGWIWQPITKRV